MFEKDLHPLFHGVLDVSLPVNDDGGEYTYVMSLTKDTNVFRVVLQHLSGEDINADDFVFSIEDCNGWVSHKNSLIDDEPITYCAWATYSADAGVDVLTKAGVDVMPEVGNRAISTVKAAVAELTVSRLVARDWSLYTRPMLIIRTIEGKLIVSIPVIDYALMVKGECNKKMSDQEYLDRADEYNMTFFLNENNKWVSTMIQVLSWKVVRSNVDLD
ncbi:FimB/Mfa2 family fimbrial subunit [Bacteroides sp. BFG-638]|uniref:FimB/Mfa2 family fimbrial subunit n=1 Tax=Bacteroides sp. BFG-638 TaxID=2972765 RepID=UPI002165F0AC|nr:FimB/Mfa2 family fimbrial subunit [Bacteroides sp. BFG-638]MCS2950555.1 FimB/Mfa2 family fimbrial subunit [Bacteroides sp. BFG-638]